MFLTQEFSVLCVYGSWAEKLMLITFRRNASNNGGNCNCWALARSKSTSGRWTALCVRVAARRSGELFQKPQFHERGELRLRQSRGDARHEDRGGTVGRHDHTESRLRCAATSLARSAMRPCHRNCPFSST